MSHDEQAEQHVYDAIAEVAEATRHRPNERKRIGLEIIKLAAKLAGVEVELQ